MRHVHSFTQEVKIKLLAYSGLMKDNDFLQALKGDYHESLDLCMAGDDDTILKAILKEGNDIDTDLTIRLFQKMLETRRPMITYARLGGLDGLRMTRAAFAVMIKFSDLLEDFIALVDAVGMQNNLEEEATRDQNLIALIKDQPHSEILVNRWESAARMRQWINEKK